MAGDTDEKMGDIEVYRDGDDLVVRTTRPIDHLEIRPGTHRQIRVRAVGPTF